MRSYLLLALLTLLLMQGRAAEAVTLYVNNLIGSDTASGQAVDLQGEHGPLQTLTAAAAMAGWGDRIVIANTGTPYREMLCLTGPHHSGSARQPFVIEGNGAVLDGTVAAAPKAWQHVTGDLFAFRPRRLTYQQLFLQGKPLHHVRVSSKADLSQLKPLEWALYDQKIYFRVEPARLPASYGLRHSGLQTGITLYNLHNLRIENLVLQGFQQEGINAHELVTHCKLVNVECRANGRAGLSVGGASRVTVTRSNFYDNGRVQVRTEGLARLELTDCDVSQATARAFNANGKSLTVDGTPVATP